MRTASDPARDFMRGCDITFTHSTNTIDKDIVRTSVCDSILIAIMIGLHSIGTVFSRAGRHINYSFNVE